MAEEKAHDSGPESLFVQGAPMDGRFTRDDSELLNGSPRFLSKDDDGLQLSIYRIAEGHWVFALHAEGGARSPTQSAESPTKSPIDSEPAALGFRTNGIVRWPHHAHSWEEWFEDNSQDGGQWYLAKGLVVRDGEEVSPKEERDIEASYLQAAVGQTLLVRHQEQPEAAAAAEVEAVPNSPVKICRRRGRRPRQKPNAAVVEEGIAEAKGVGNGEVGGDGGRGGGGDYGGGASDDKAEIERLKKELAEAKQEVGRLRAASNSLQVVHSDEISWDEPRVRLGSGGFGVVWRSRRGGWQGVTVAVKELRLDTEALEDDAVQELKREGEVLGMVRHPNVVGFLGLCADPVSPFIVTEFVGGGSLHEVLYKRSKVPPLTLREKMRVSAEVAAGLEHLHSKPLLHRDLKPGNILLTSSGQAKVCDFGLSRALTCTRAYFRTHVRGTPLCKSSEETPSLAVFMYSILVWSGKRLTT
jgi:hypothetical protein